MRLDRKIEKFLETPCQMAPLIQSILMLSVWSSVLQIQRTGGNEIGSRTSDFEKRQVLRRAEL